LSFRERLDLVARIEQTLRTNARIGGTISAVDYLPVLPNARPQSPWEQMALERQMQVAQATLRRANYLHADKSGESFRVTGFVSALDDIDYGRFLEDVRLEVERSLRQVDWGAGGMSVRYTGIMPLVHEIQRQLLQDLYASFLTAFVVIAIVMTLVQAGFRAGLIAMVPNVFPTLIMFGAIGWSQSDVDIGSMMTASVALGIAVDDTLHFLTFFRNCLNDGASRMDAVLAACRHCGRAMLQTTLVCGLGLLTFALAEFVPTARFAWMMLALLVLAIVGDLVVLPALLLGPAGLLFARTSIRSRQPDDVGSNASISGLAPRLTRSSAVVSTSAARRHSRHHGPSRETDLPSWRFSK
jgi:Cu/Ag efflux pump CusA